MFILILARLRNQFKNTEGKVITALPRSLLEEGRRRRADSTHQDGTSFPAQPCAGVQQRQGSSPPSLVTPKHFLKRSQIYSLDPCGFPQSPCPKTRMHVSKERGKTTCRLWVTTHRSRVEFSCSLSLSMTGWIPSMRNSYLRCSLKSRLSCQGQLLGQHSKVHFLKNLTNKPRTHQKTTLTKTPGAHHACSLAQDRVDEGHDRCLEAHFIPIPPRALVQVIDQRLSNPQGKLRAQVLHELPEDTRVNKFSQCSQSPCSNSLVMLSRPAAAA